MKCLTILTIIFDINLLTFVMLTESGLKKCLKKIQTQNNINKRDFNLMYLSVLGTLPSNEEIARLFKQSEIIGKNALENFFKEKIAYSLDIEVYALEIFHALDHHGKHKSFFP